MIIFTIHILLDVAIQNNLIDYFASTHDVAIEEEVKFALSGGEYARCYLRDAIKREYGDDNVMLEVFDEKYVEQLLPYVSFDRNSAAFSEPYLNDHFYADVPCFFDADRFYRSLGRKPTVLTVAKQHIS